MHSGSLNKLNWIVPKCLDNFCSLPKSGKRAYLSAWLNSEADIVSLNFKDLETLTLAKLPFFYTESFEELNFCVS